MYSNDDVGDDMAAWREKCNAPLTKLEMDGVVQQCRRSVTCTLKGEPNNNICVALSLYIPTKGERKTSEMTTKVRL